MSEVSIVSVWCGVGEDSVKDTEEKTTMRGSLAWSLIRPPSRLMVPLSVARQRRGECGVVWGVQSVARWGGELGWVEGG